VASSNIASRDTVVLAFQLDEFIQSGHAFAGEVDDITRHIISHLIRRNFRPAQPLRSLNPREQRARLRSTEAPSWPSDWAVNVTAFRAAITRFQAGTQATRQFLEAPASAGNTPPSSPPSSGQGPSSSSPNTSLSGHSTRQTSAEEAIYQRPLGPNQRPQQSSTMANAGFNETQLTELRNLIASLVAAPPAGPPGPPGPQGPQGPQSDSTASATSKWNAGDLGFFDPMYNGKSASTGSSLEHASKETYFRDIHLFIERAKDLATIKGAMVRENLWTCLRGTALEWYTAELSDTEKRLSKYGATDADITEWTQLLAGRFKEPSNVAIDAVLRERYSMRDTSSRREPREYAQKILRSAKDAGMSLLQNQLDIIYNGIDLELRRDVKRPDNNTTINSFLTSLDDCKHEWWALASRKSERHNRSVPPNRSNNNNSNSYGQRQPQQYGQYQNFRQPFIPYRPAEGFGGGYRPSYRGAPPYGSNNTSYGSNPYRPFSSSSSFQPQQSNVNQQQQQQNPNRLPPPGRQLQITNGSSSPSPGQKTFPPRYQDQGSGAGRSFNRNPFRKPFSTQRAYHTEDQEAAKDVSHDEDQSAESFRQTENLYDESQGSYYSSQEDAFYQGTA